MQVKIYNSEGKELEITECHIDDDGVLIVVC
jgi:hypothetical protein